MEPARLRLYNAAYYLCVSALIFILIKVLSYIHELVIVVIASIFLAYILLPLVRLLESPVTIKIPDKITVKDKEINLFKDVITLKITKKGFSRILAVTVVYFFLFIIVTIFISYITPRLIYEFNHLKHNLPEFANYSQQKLRDFNSWLTPQLPDDLKNFVPNTIEKASNQLEEYAYKTATYTFSLAQRIIKILLELILIPVFAFYLILDIDNYKKYFQTIIPEDRKEEINGLLREVDGALGRFIRGQIVVSILIGMFITIALICLRIDYAFLIGTLCGITNFVPYLGVIVSLVPAGLLALTTKGFLYMLITFVVLESIHMIEGHIITPTIMGEAVGISPLMIMIALIIGGHLMGIVGMFIAVPFAATSKAVFNYYIDRMKADKERTASESSQIT